MVDSETRALRRTTIVLLLVSAVRWGWPGGAPSEVAGAADDLPALLDATRAAADEAERRGRPIQPGELIDANSAGEAEFDRLPGIGPSTATRIVAHRDEVGGFATAADLLAVRGVGPRTLDRIAPSLTFGPMEAGRRPGRRDFGAPAGRRPQPNVRAQGAEAAGPAAIARAGGGVGTPLVDVNRADAARLATLPGIGPELARRIIDTRRERPFRSASDLQRVRGIGAATVARLTPLIRISGPE